MRSARKDFRNHEREISRPRREEGSFRPVRSLSGCLEAHSNRPKDGRRERDGRNRVLNAKSSYSEPCVCPIMLYMERPMNWREIATFVDWVRPEVEGMFV